MQDALNAFNIKVKTKKNKVPAFDRRVALIDFLRGVLIILVIFDHIMYDLRDFLPLFFEAAGTDSGAFYEFCKWFIIDNGPDCYFRNPWRLQIRELCLCAFVFLSGISCAFSKDNWKRAGKMIAFWLALGVITNIANGYAQELNLGFYSLVINFNIIGVIAVSVLIYCFVQKKSPVFLFFFSIGLLLISAFLLPKFQHDIGDNSVLLFFFWKPQGVFINNEAYHIADYMPLFPYIIFFFLGAIISKIVYANPAEHLHKNKKWMKPCAYIGRYSLYFYFGHQFVIYGLFMFIAWCMGAY